MADRRPFLSVSAAAAVAAPVLGATAADAAPRGFSVPGRPVRPQKPDRELREMLREIDHRRIEATVRRLVAFGTRHTLSSQTDPVRGIGAARDWLFEQFQAVAAASGGRMSVERQSFVQPPGARNPEPVTVTNIVATLHGTVSPGRVHVVSGH